MTNLASVHEALPELLEAWAARRIDGVVLFGPDGEEVGRAGELVLPEPVTLCAPTAEQPVAVEGLPADSRVVVYPLEAYGQYLGSVAWVAQGREPDPAALLVGEAASRLLGRLVTSDFEIENLSRELAETYESIHFLCDAAAESSHATSVEHLCSILLDALMRHVTCRGGLILLLRGEGTAEEALVVAASQGDLPTVPQGIRLRSDALRRLLESRAPLLLDDVAAATRATSDPLLDAARRSLLAAPLTAQEQVVGALALIDRDHEGRPGPFDSRDRKLVDAIAQQGAAIVLGMRMVEVSKEFEIGRRIQQSLLPESLPRLAGMEVAARCTMARQVGGDYYDVVEDGSGVVHAVIADVSGHDLGAALLMAEARATLRSELRGTQGPGTILTRLNRLLHADLRRAGLFLTSFVLTVDPARTCFHWSGAGHPPAFYLPVGEERPLWLESPGMPAGLLSGNSYPDLRQRCRDGDLVLLHTDGWTEAASPEGEVFGEERLGEALVRWRALPVAEILAHLEAEILDFTGEDALLDDATALLLRIGDGTEERAETAR